MDPRDGLGITKPVDLGSVSVYENHFHVKSAIQAVRGAAESWIVGAYGHLYHVQISRVVRVSLITDLAACLTDMLIGAWLWVVPAMWFTWVMRP
jgi:hypothetical protein